MRFAFGKMKPCILGAIRITIQNYPTPMSKDAEDLLVQIIYSNWCREEATKYGYDFEKNQVNG